MLDRPLSERSEPLCETAAIGRVVCLPDPPGNFRELLFQVLRSVPDLEPRVQEALQDDHRREQCLPRRLRPLPAIGADF